VLLPPPMSGFTLNMHIIACMSCGDRLATGNDARHDGHFCIQLRSRFIGILDLLPNLQHNVVLT